MKYLLSTLLGFGALMPSMAFSSSLDKLEFDTQASKVQLEHLLREEIEELGFVKANRKNSKYMTNDDIVYLDFKKANSSVGDKFMVVRPIDNVSFQKKGEKVRSKHYQILGQVRVTNVRPDLVEAEVKNASNDIVVGDLIVPVINRVFTVNPKEPSVEMTGKVIKGAGKITLIGPYQFAFLDLGTKDGIELNDRFVVLKKSHAKISAKERIDLPDIEVAKGVIVDADEHVSTIYMLAGTQIFESGTMIKSDIAKVRYLNQTDIDLSVESASELPNQ